MHFAPLLLVAALAAPASYTPSAASDCLDLIQEATAREVDRVGARPTIISRQMAMAVTAMYDAWAAYDEKAVGTRFGGKLRRPAAERTDANKTRAIAYATYRVLEDVFADDRAWLEQQMRAKGYDPNDRSIDITTPQGIGNAAAAAVLAYRHHDGANQLGNEVGGNGKPYSDYTYYKPVNTLEKVLDPDRWQPIPFHNPRGGDPFAPGFLTPHWYRVKTFGLDSPDQFRAPAPPVVGSEQLKAEVDEVIRFNASLTPQQKAIVEFMRDGPRSTGQSGHWLKFAQMVSKRDRHDIDQDVKLYFAVANAAMDAFIASWETKRYYDSSRPWTLVRHYYADKTVTGWAGPGRGVVTLKASEWHPYSPAVFPTPPFPGYVSGHSTVSAACARTLELFTGSDQFGEVEKRRAGALTEAEFNCGMMQAVNGTAAAEAVGCDVELPLPTFTATAEMAGISRVMGGYHIQADNIEGLKMGKRVADFIWPRIQAHFDGIAEPRP